MEGSNEMKMLWDSIPEERRKVIHDGINATMTKMVKEETIKFNVPYNWNMNFPFDREKPVQYIYLEGVFGIIKGKNENGELMDAIINRFNHVEISDNVDAYLDKRDEINEAEGLLFKADEKGVDISSSTD